MFSNYLKITLRNLIKNKAFVFINILGMGTAIGCCIVAYLNYDFNLNFDEDQKNIQDVYRIEIKREYNGDIQHYGMSPTPLGMAVANNFGDVEAVLRYIPADGNFRIGDDLFNTNFTFVDDTFFDFFTFNLISGTKEDLLDKSKIFISEEIAAKHFPEGDPVGKMLTHLTDAKGPKDYTVVGVFKKMPLNSSFAHIEVITNIQNYFDLQAGGAENDWSTFVTTFVKVKDDKRLSIVEDQLKDYIEIQNKARIDFQINKYLLAPVQGMAHRAANDEIHGHWLNESLPPPAVVAPVIMGLLILLIACFNFTNTSIAISSKRLKEIGLRKVMGGLRKQLVFQFMLENIILCFLSLLVGLVIAAFLVPAYSEMWPFLDLQLTFVGNYGFLLFLICLLLFIGLLAGSYPALYISKFEPASILKGSSKLGGSSKLTNSLLTLQFTISLLAIILGVVFYQNANYQEELDFGFEKDGVITLNFQNEDEYRAFENLISHGPRLLTIAGSEYQINWSYRNDPIASEDKSFDTDILHIGENYFEALGFTLIEGRKFREESGTDFQESVIVSEKFVELFGWKDPVGKKLVWMDTVQLYVVGVMKDAYLNGLWDPVEPLMLRYVPSEKYQFMSVRANPSDLIAVNEFLESQWKVLFPDRMYNGAYMDESMGEAANINGNILKLFSFLGVVATLLSAIGLFSMVSLNILKRMKEIGVRKVLGAPVYNIIGVLNKNFVIILIIASLLGSVCSYYLGNALMGSIWTYHVDPGIFSFVLSVLLIFMVSGITIGYKVYKAATANPVNTLRSE